MTRGSLLGRLQATEAGAVDDQDWRIFLEIYQPLLFAYARREGLDQDQAEDVVQEILLGISKRLPEFEYRPERCRFRTWMYRIAANKVADYWRRRYRELPEVGPCLVDGEGLVGGKKPVVIDTSTLEPDAAWDAKFEEELLAKARKLAGQRASPMNFRLYLYHVVNGHDVAETVTAFRESLVTAAQVHLAKSRVLKLVEEELAKLQRQYGD